MKKTKVLLLQGSLMHYRVPCWNIIADKYDLTVGYYDNDQTKSDICRFKKIKFDVSRIGNFDFVKNVRKTAKNYDVVIFMDDLHVPAYITIPFLPHKYKVITWGIGFRVSYTRPYVTKRKHTILDKVEECILNKSDAIIFYMNKAKEFWESTSIDMSKVFCAPNTTDVAPIKVNIEDKRDFLFVGSLYRGKGVDLLLKAFAEAKRQVKSADNKLIIIGGGEMKDELEEMTANMGLTSEVIFVGAVYDEVVLATYFKTALLCISPSQGGLSCPKSMGYGVPFVTRRDAITGGEIYHMTPGVNGIMYDNDSDLKDILVDSMQNTDKYCKMGIAAKEYYDNNATPKHMAQGAINAIMYVLDKQ